MPLIVMCRKFGPPALWMVTPGVPEARWSLFTSGPMSMKSISPLSRASMCPSAGMARKMIRSSLARSPHHLSSRTMVRVLAVSSMPSNLNGPAVTGILPIQPSL